MYMCIKMFIDPFVTLSKIGWIQIISYFLSFIHSFRLNSMCTWLGILYRFSNDFKYFSIHKYALLVANRTKFPKYINDKLAHWRLPIVRFLAHILKISYPPLLSVLSSSSSTFQGTCSRVSDTLCVLLEFIQTNGWKQQQRSSFKSIVNEVQWTATFIYKIYVSDF